MKKWLLVLTLLYFSCAYGKDTVFYNEAKIKDLYLNTDKYIYSTSHLEEKDLKFIPENLVDDEAKLPWATRKNGGEGEEILIFFARMSYEDVTKWVKGFEIINGFTNSKALFEQNNRVKEVDSFLYKVYYDNRENDRSLVRGDVLLGFYLIESNNFQLGNDYLAKNQFYFKTDLEKEDKGKNVKKYPTKYAMVLKIKSVYKGSKYNDLCISKINFLYDWPVTNK